MTQILKTNTQYSRDTHTLLWQRRRCVEKHYNDNNKNDLKKIRDNFFMARNVYGYRYLRVSTAVTENFTISQDQGRRYNDNTRLIVNNAYYNSCKYASQTFLIIFRDIIIILTSIL